MVKWLPGGYRDYLALLDDSSAYEDVLLVMEAERDAQRILELQAEAKRR